MLAWSIGCGAGRGSGCPPLWRRLLSDCTSAADRSWRHGACSHPSLGDASLQPPESLPILLVLLLIIRLLTVTVHSHTCKEKRTVSVAAVAAGGASLTR